MRLVKLKEGVYVNPAFVVSITAKPDWNNSGNGGSVVLFMGGIAHEAPGNPSETAQVLEIPPSTPTPLDTPKKKEEPKEEPRLPTTVLPIVRSKGITLASFTLFWSAYPKKVGKGEAERVWKRIHPNAVLLNRMLQAIMEQEGTKQWKEGFVPNPGTWLNQKRWEDEVEKPRDLRDSVKGVFG